MSYIGAFVGIILLLLFLKLVGTSIKWIVKLMINSVIGFILLFVVNALFGGFGLHIEPTFLSCLISGFFGIPGVIALVLFQNL